MFYKLSALALALTLTACGGGGSSDSGSTGTPTNNGNSGGGEPVMDQETITVAEASVSLTKSIIVNQLTGVPSVSSASTKPSARFLSQAKASDENVTVGSCGGTATSTSESTDESTYPYSFWVDVNYEDYCLSSGGYQFVYNGLATVDSYFESLEDFTIVYMYDLTFTSDVPGYEMGAMKTREDCVKEPNKEEKCTAYISDLYSSYSIQNAGVDGDDVNGYGFRSKVYAQDSEAYDIQAEGVLFCDENKLGSGNIIVEVDNYEAEIEFFSCGEYTLTYRGVSQTYHQ
ncbi:hypothetical protein [Teredinibacter turnerae]|uniref:hypothetical protein n=1 Tax=Teredinibacter turnerae TaxID=2426 RepID=UPI0004230746|nr:hypothetical protein [Teredinibacter turnerae]